MTHTPGPWENHGAMIIGPNGAIAVDPSSVGMAAADHNSEANARLIAAAPELLEACKAFVEGRPTKEPPRYATIAHNNWELFEQARAALAKARGEQ